MYLGTLATAVTVPIKDGLAISPIASKPISATSISWPAAALPIASPAPPPTACTPSPAAADAALPA